MPDCRDTCQNRVLTDLHQQWISIRTDGGSTVEGCTRRQSPHDLINSPWTSSDRRCIHAHAECLTPCRALEAHLTSISDAQKLTLSCEAARPMRSTVHRLTSPFSNPTWST